MKKFPLYLKILVGMAAGALVGVLAGPQAAPLGEFGKVIIQAIKTLAAPLLFCAILDAFLRTHIQARSAARMVAISSVNAAIAVAIGLTVSNVLKPGRFLKLLEATPTALGGSPALPAGKIDFLKTLTGYVPTSLIQPFVENAVISIIIVAVIAGLALRRVKHEHIAHQKHGYLVIENAVETFMRALEVALGWIIKLIPIAVFGVVAKTVGEQGFAPIKGLLSYLGVVLFALSLHVGLVYQSWIVIGAKMRLKDFWRGARDPVVYVIGAASSLATLPVTLKSLDDMGVSPQSARLAACVGTNLNNDGILLYEALAILFVAQAHGIHLSFAQQLVAALSCVVAGVGITGVPEAGLISLSLALTTVGLPTEILPLLLTVDWILGRARAVTNVVSDMLVAVLLDRFQEGVPTRTVPATSVTET
jgi:Na+/H+-dicarboxylate symporter